LSGRRLGLQLSFLGSSQLGLAPGFCIGLALGFCGLRSRLGFGLGLRLGCGCLALIGYALFLLSLPLLALMWVGWATPGRAAVDTDGRRRVISQVKRISKPGRRIYAKKDNLPKVLGGLGTAVISTSRGLMTAREAQRLGVGGEVVCFVW